LPPLGRKAGRGLFVFFKRSPHAMSITIGNIQSSSDDLLLKLLGDELRRRISADKAAPEFVAQIRLLPAGLRAMAATHELDVSLALDDLGWHFGNWHNIDLAEETARGLEELGATELAAIFRAAFQIAGAYWTELGSEGWTEWYHGSALKQALEPLNRQTEAVLEKNQLGIFKYWLDYARRHPDRVGAVP
jgi:hypothetical protein